MDNTHISSLIKEWKALQPLNPLDEKRLDEKFRMEFNYNSNHLEGNTLTYGQTQLLLMFDQTEGNHELREYEEMKAHDVALKMIKEEAMDKERPLTENFIRLLNETILVRPFWKEAETFDGAKTRIEIKIGKYKTRPNHVRTSTGEIFYYASPEETPSLMHDLVNWFNTAKQEKTLTPIELATLLHYKYIRIHPFEDGNGRVARLLTNYVLYSCDYPPIIIKSLDKENYLRALRITDINTGLDLHDALKKGIESMDSFASYLSNELIWSLNLAIKAGKGESIEELNDWSKRLELRLKDSNQKKNTLLEQKNTVLQDSFYRVVKAMDNAFFVFEKYFMEVKKLLPENLKNIEDFKQISAKEIKKAEYITEYYINEHSLPFLYRISCKFEEESYTISIFAGELKNRHIGIRKNPKQISKPYNNPLSQQEINSLIEFVGHEFEEFMGTHVLNKR